MDESDVPARNYTLVISDIYNHTISDVQPIVNQTFSDLLGKPVELFGSDAQYLNITASNNLGSTVVYRQILDIPVFCELLTMPDLSTSLSLSPSLLAPSLPSSLSLHLSPHSLFPSLPRSSLPPSLFLSLTLSIGFDL